MELKDGFEIAAGLSVFCGQQNWCGVHLTMLWSGK